jgi:hypothetical protein
MPSITGRVTLKHELRLVQMTSFHCSGVMRWKVVSRVMPALLTRMSTGPSWRSMSRTIASASAAVETSPRAIATSTPLGAHLRLPRLRLFLVAVVGGDLVAHAGQALDDRGADAASTAGDECDARLHLFSP